ncbi:unnamed protein product [Cochlearia groenlandica]
MTFQSFSNADRNRAASCALDSFAEEASLDSIAEEGGNRKKKKEIERRFETNRMKKKKVAPFDSIADSIAKRRREMSLGFFGKVKH